MYFFLCEKRKCLAKCLRMQSSNEQINKKIVCIDCIFVHLSIVDTNGCLLAQTHTHTHQPTTFNANRQSWSLRNGNDNGLDGNDDDEDINNHWYRIISIRAYCMRECLSSLAHKGIMRKCTTLILCVRI